MKRFWIFVMIAGIAVLAMSAFQFMTRPSSGDPAPSFALQTIDGSTMTLDDFRGRPLIIHFWATWCGVCVHEFPALMRLARDLAPEGLAVAAVSEEGKPGDKAVREFFRGEKPPFPVLIDGDGSVADAYRSWGVPETVMVDRNGFIVWRRAGAIDWDDHDVRAYIRASMGGDRPTVE